jgi:hypothetical protein
MRGKVNRMDTTYLAALAAFRAAAYHAFGRRRDALFELCATLLTTGPVPSLPFLSVPPPPQRRWGSLYDALAVGEISDRPLEQLLTRHLLAGGEPIYAVEASVWPRSDAETSPERGIYAHAARPCAGQPVVAGGAYSWIAQLGFARASWTAPLRGRRRRPQENSNLVAAEQITALLPHLPAAHAEGALPWFVFDAGYDPVQLPQALGDAHAASLVRLRAGRCFDAAPTHCAAAHRAAPPSRTPGQLCCPQTWPPPDGDLSVEDAPYGTVRVRAWTRLHPKTQGELAPREGRGRRPLVHGPLLLVEVSRLPQQPREPQALWLGWHGPPEAAVPDLDRAGRADVRRFDVEHTFRFLKQPLTGTLPRVRHPEQADRWTWLVVLA